MFPWTLGAPRVANFAKDILFTIRARSTLSVCEMDGFRPDDYDRCFAATAFIRYSVTGVPCVDEVSSFSINGLTHERIVGVWCDQRNRISARISDSA